MQKNILATGQSDERLELLFRHTGLSEKQAKLYRILLADGPQRPAFLSRKSGIKRGNTYALLRDLKLYGLVTEFEKGKISYFRPEPPSKLLELIAGREKDINIAKELARDMVPHLTSQWKTSVNRPIVRHVEGEEGLQSIFEDIYLPNKKEIHGCVDLEVVNAVFPEHIVKQLIPRRVKYHIKAWALLADSTDARTVAEADERQLRTSILFDKKNYPLPAEIEVYEDKIAFMSFNQGEFTGIIIQNNDFAQSLRSIFRYVFDSDSKKSTSP